MPSDRLFGPAFTTPQMAEAVSEEAWLEAMLAVEAAAAKAAAAVGLIPHEAGQAIAACCRAGSFDVSSLGREAAATGTPVLPLVRELAAAAGPHGAHVHRGMTSQDVIDTAMMLIARRGLDLLLADLDAVADGCARLAQAHRSTPMLGRTLLQPAAPITFGLKAAGWLVAALDARRLLAEIRDRRLALQLGGAAGTLAGLAPHGLQVMARMSEELDLAEPILPWHTARGRVAELGSALAIAAGAMGKIALDVALLAQGEVGEAREGGDEGRGRSTAMPHKRNPVAAVAVAACVRGVDAQAALLVAALPQEHERAAGAWQAEWNALGEAFRLAGGAVARTREALEVLEIDPGAMRRNLERAASGAGFDAAEGLTAVPELVDRALAAYRYEASKRARR